MTEVINSKATKDVYYFDALSESFERAGQYAVVYTMAPARPNADALSLTTTLQVDAGPAVEMVVQVASSCTCYATVPVSYKPCPLGGGMVGG